MYLLMENRFSDPFACFYGIDKGVAVAAANARHDPCRQPDITILFAGKLNFALMPSINMLRNPAVSCRDLLYHAVFIYFPKEDRSSACHIQ